MKQIIVNVGGLTIAEKKRVNEALAKIKGVRMCDPMHWDKTDVMYGPSIDGVNVGFDYSKVTNPTHTPQQVLEMAGMAKQGHVHAESMALYAEDAKTTDKPWELWQIKARFTDGHKWVSFNSGFHFDDRCKYRRKPKTHIVHGVEVPDLRFEPKIGEAYHVPDPLATQLYLSADFTSQTHSPRKDNNLCYEYTEAGKQAAILHAKAWLGIA